MACTFPAGSYTVVVIGEASGPAPSGSGYVTCVTRPIASYTDVVTLPRGSVTVLRFPAPSYPNVVLSPSASIWTCGRRFPSYWKLVVLFSGSVTVWSKPLDQVCVVT